MIMGEEASSRGMSPPRAPPGPASPTARVRSAAVQRAPSPAPAEVDWERLDKFKFFGVGTALFTGVTLALYPFSVIKTRLQISDGPALARAEPAAQVMGPSSTAAPQVLGSGASAQRSAYAGLGAPSMAQTAKEIMRSEGLAGFYRGLPTVVAGMLPGRILYMGMLEVGKSTAGRAVQALGGAQALGLSDAAAAGLASAIGGTCASLTTQAVWVPVDVISSRLMAQAAQPTAVPRYAGGFDALVSILRSEGLGGLYRGFGVSVLTYGPSSFTWWGTYGMSQRFFWNSYYNDSWPATLQLARSAPHGPTDAEGTQHSTLKDLARGPPPLWLLAMVQAGGGCLAGVCAAVVTTPLDTVRVRIQVDRGSAPSSADGAGKPRAVAYKSMGSVVRQLWAEGGLAGFYKGVVPRSISMALWGTCMVSAYEFLKRLSMVER